MSQTYRQLVLYPQDSQWTPDSLEDLCVRLGLAGARIEPADNGRFYIGEQFLQHINFMGCAPAVEFAPQPDQPPDYTRLTFIYLPKIHAEAYTVCDLDMARPVCPHCDKRITKPRQHLSADQRSLHCPFCATKSALDKFAWREFGAHARTMIGIANVYPKEAIPTEHMLQEMQRLSDTAWAYFYFNGPLIV